MVRHRRVPLQHTVADGSAVNKSGWLNAKKSKVKAFSRFVSGQWKRRFITLTGTDLSMYKDENFAESGAKPVQIVPLLLTVVTLTVEDDGNAVLKLEAKSWTKKGRPMTSPRTFYLQAPSREVADEWLFLLQLVCEKLKRTASSTAIVDEKTAEQVAANASNLPVILETAASDSGLDVGEAMPDRLSTSSQSSRLAVTSSGKRRVSYAVADLLLPSANKNIGSDQVGVLRAEVRCVAVMGYAYVSGCHYNGIRELLDSWEVSRVH
jgi:PH domain